MTSRTGDVPPGKPSLKAGTRRSPLALAQTRKAVSLLQAEFPELDVEIVPMETSGDRNLEKPPYELGGREAFVKELQDRLLAREIDFAVHSLKDMSSQPNSAFEVPAILERENPLDVLVSNRFESLADHPSGAVIGTSSPRRQKRLGDLRPDCEIRFVRGNLQTRLKKLDEGRYDSLVLAAAGLIRLGLEQRIRRFFTVEEMIPAAGQGAVAIECLAGNEACIRTLSAIDHLPTRRKVESEIAFAGRLNGNCRSSIAAYAEGLDDGKILLRGSFHSPIAGERLTATEEGKPEERLQIGMLAAERIIDRLTPEERKRSALPLG